MISNGNDLGTLNAAELDFGAVRSVSSNGDELRQDTRGRKITNTSPEAEQRRARDRARRAKMKAERGAAPQAGASPSTAPATPSPAAQTAQPGKQKTLQQEIDELKAGYTTADPVNGPQTPGTGQPGAPMATLVSGYVLVMVMDAMVPALVAWGVNRFGGRDDVSADMLRLTQREKDAIEPIADRAASFILGRIDPVTLFFTVYGAMCITKIPKNTAPKKVKEPKKDPANA